MKKTTISLLTFFILFFNYSFSQITFVDSILSGGIYRNYRLYIPAAYTGSTARPLILNLHGYTSDALAQQLYSNFMPIADTANFLMVYPNGTKINNQSYWNAGFGPGVDDIQFMSDLINHLSSQYSIDPNCVYSTGMSNGGYMSYTLACALNNKIAAIASVTGSMVTPQYLSCLPNRAVPVMQIHGTADGTVPYNGLPTSIAIDTLVKYWVQNNNCNTSAIFNNVPNINLIDGCTAEHYVYNGGDNGSSVELYKIIGGGHTWPGTYPIGVTCQDFNASEKIWLFFRKYKLNQFIGIEEINNNSLFSVFPNPSDKTITIEGDVLSVSIVDMTGKVVLASKQKQIDISQLAKGIYSIMLVSEKTRVTRKFVKI